MATQSQQLKKELKAAFPGVKFSVRGDHNSINVTYTDGPGKKAVEAIANKYKKVDYCEYSGEILSGANTFVWVERNISPEMKVEFMSVMASKGYTEADQHDHWYRQDWKILVDGDYCKIDPAARMEQLAAEAAAKAEEEAKEAEDLAGGFTTVDAEIVINPVQVEIKPFFGVAKFAALNKNNTIDEYKFECDLPEFSKGSKCPNWRIERIKVVEHWTMTNEEYDEYMVSLMTANMSIDFLAGKGRTKSHNEDQLRKVEYFHQYTEEEQAIWREGAYRLVIAVSAPSRDVIVIDPSGYNYARYVGLVEEQETIKGLLMDRAIVPTIERLPQAPIELPASPLQLVPTDFNPRNNPTFVHEGEIVYVVKFAKVENGIPFTWICQGISGKRYEVRSEVVSQHTQKAA